MHGRVRICMLNVVTAKYFKSTRWLICTQTHWHANDRRPTEHNGNINVVKITVLLCFWSELSSRISKQIKDFDAVGMVILNSKKHQEKKK